jgi:recombination protein RecR
MDTIDKLTELFKEFPGIGERQARRFVYFLMSRNNDYTGQLTKLIGELKKEVSQCSQCFRYFLARNSESSKVCEICNSVATDKTMLMVVEKDSDLESVRKSRVYSGLYFVLGGLVPVVEKNTNRSVRIPELIKNIEKNGELREVILAFSLNPHGDHTDSYVRNQISEISTKKNLKISSLGRGLSTGTELEYSDNDTLKNALKNRQ